MQTFFVEIKCKLGKTYAVANALADREIASEIYSTAGNYDILAKFHVDDGVDIGHFIAENVQVIPEIADTHTIITFKDFWSPDTMRFGFSTGQRSIDGAYDAG